MSLFQFKLISAAIIFLMIIFAAWIPFRKSWKSAHGHSFPIGEALAAGVFLGAGLIHMLSDSFWEFADAGYDYPFPFLLCGLIFLLLLSLEHIGMELKKSAADENSTIAILAVFMLSVHSLLAGTALGISHSLSSMMVILIAILAHKWAESFSLAVVINKTPLTKTMRFVYFFIFAFMTPLGILAGTTLESFFGGYDVLEAIFNSMAAGTFIYIGTLHGLKRSVMVERCCNLKEFLWVIIGFLLMAIVAIWT